MSGAEQHDIAVATRNQFHSAKNECSHEDFAEFGVGLHERLQLFTSDFHHFRRLPRADSNHHPPARQNTYFSGKLAWPDNHKHLLIPAGRPDDLQIAFPDKEHARVGCSILD